MIVGTKTATIVDNERLMGHANFIVNAGSATGTDVRNLMREVEEKVMQQTGVRLEREVRLLD